MVLGLTAIAIYALMALLVLATHDWDPKTFIVQRPENVDFSREWGIGYDGQFSYAIAVDPLGAGDSGAIDRPAYRYMRIIYPIVARILALGIPELVPWTLLLVNILATGVTAWLLTDMVGLGKGAAWVVFITLLSFNYLIGFRFSLNEPLGLMLAIAGLWLHRRHRVVLATLALALAGLAKEVFLVFAIAVAIYEATQRNFKRAALILVGSLAPYLIWATVVTQWHGVSPFSYSLSRPSLIPFAGLRHLWPFESQLMVSIWVIVPAILVALAVVWKSVRERPSWPSLLAWLMLVNVVLLATLPVESWEDPLAIMRLGLGALVVGLLWLSQEKPRLLPYASAFWIPTLLIAFLIPGFFI